MTFKTEVSIDRITVVGEVTKDSIIEFVSRSDSWVVTSDDSFNLIRELDNGFTENIAHLGKSKYQSSYRLDTSVHFDLDGFYYEEIKGVLDLFNNPRFSRLDIAFDIFNIEELDMPAMAHRLYKSNIGERTYMTEIKGKGKQIETIYYGSARSLEQVRYYNKLVEMKTKKREISNNIKSWERLELQLRGFKTSEWFESANKLLTNFKLPELHNVKNAQDRATLYALESGVIDYSELSSATAARYRKMQSLNIGYNTSLSNILANALLKDLKKIENDLYSFISNYNILLEDEFRAKVKSIQKAKKNK